MVTHVVYSYFKCLVTTVTLNSFIKYCFSYVKIDAFPDTVDPHAGLFGRGGFKL